MEKLEQLGYRQFHISGGTDLNDGFETELLVMLREIQLHSSIGIEVNFGPSFSGEALREMKRLGVESVTSSLECTVPAIFSAAKPGDSLARRIALLEACEEAGIASRSMMLIGLGESIEDRIDHLIFLRKFPHLYQLRISRFMPFAGTPYAIHPRCSSWELAHTVALARLILPDREISLGAGNGEDDIPLWYLAGGGNQLVGAFVSAKEPPKRPDVDVYRIDEYAYVIDSRKSKERILEKMGFDNVGFLPQRLLNVAPNR
ncbi:MAG: radical SAM protein [Candidatus Pelethousia sp.]|nr:radical SAM protein [Candidatus Pelethousia sp.]